MTRGVRQISLLHPDPDLVVEDTGAKSVSFFVKVWPVFVGRTMIEDMERISVERGGRNVRVCLHAGADAAHHDMVILERGGGFFPPHRHPGKAETFHVIEGALGLVNFDEAGEVVEASVIRPGEVYRLAVELYHMVIPASDLVVYHESKPGPFLGAADLIWPAWAPAAGDTAGLSALHGRAKALLDQFGTSL